MTDTNLPAMEFLTFTLHDQTYAVDIMNVREIRRWTEPTPLPRTPEFLQGVINLRGMVLPVLNLSLRLGLERADPSERTVIVVLNSADRTFGITVDAVSDIATLPGESLQPPPEMSQRDGDIRFISHLCLHEEAMIRILDATQLIPNQSPASMMTQAMSGETAA